MLKIERQLINTIFFTNQRKGISYIERVELFKVLSLRWKIQILIKKFSERIKILKKRVNG